MEKLKQNNTKNIHEMKVYAHPVRVDTEKQPKPT